MPPSRSLLIHFLILLINLHFMPIHPALKYQKMDRDDDDIVVEPVFNYQCKTQGAILDTQYTYDGEYLGIVTSNASIHVYREKIQREGVQTDHHLEYNSSTKNNSYLKLAWSYTDPFLLAVCSISKEISCFEVTPSEISKKCYKAYQHIPTHLAWFPSGKSKVLAAGFSCGTINILNDQLENLWVQKAHDQSVNWINWEYKFEKSEKNAWITRYFPEQINQYAQKEKYPRCLLGSCSSDKTIKIWMFYSRQDRRSASGQIQIQQQFRSQDVVFELKDTIMAHQAEIRQIMWKPNYFIQTPIKNLISCSEDGEVKCWEIEAKENGKITHKEKSSKKMKPPVYRAEYNPLGNLIAISYRNETDQRIQTSIFKDDMGSLGEEVHHFT